jgi:hypothetical protein
MMRGWGCILLCVHEAWCSGRVFTSVRAGDVVKGSLEQSGERGAILLIMLTTSQGCMSRKVIDVGRMTKAFPDVDGPTVNVPKLHPGGTIAEENTEIEVASPEHLLMFCRRLHVCPDRRVRSCGLCRCRM